MFYIPSNLKNQNYTYYISNSNYIVVRTNDNCYTQYQTTYCDCIDLYPSLDYIYSNRYSCSTSSYSHTIPYDKISNDYWYRLDLDKILVIFIIIVLFSSYFPYKLFKTFRKRVK